MLRVGLIIPVSGCSFIFPLNFRASLVSQGILCLETIANTVCLIKI